MNTKKRGPWTTAREIDFLTRLGVYQFDDTGDKSSRPTRRELLQLYVDSMDKRDEWDDVDPVEVEMYCRRELAGFKSWAKGRG